MNLNWTHIDYALRGDFCPLDDIATWLQSLRVETGAIGLIHVALDHETILKSLTWVALADAEESIRINDFVQQANFRSTNRHLNEAIAAMMTGRFEREASLLDDEIAAGLLACLCQTVDANQHKNGALSRLQSMSWRAVALSHMGTDGLEPRDGEVRSVILMGHSSSTEAANLDLSLEAERYRILGVMLKCTHHANARRDAVVMELVRGELWPSGSTTDEEDFTQVATRGLELACKITGSTGGAVYEQTPRVPEHLFRIAVVEGLDFKYPPTALNDESNSVGWVAHRHRAWQQIAGSSPVGTPSRAVSSLEGTELVTPIAGPLANTGDRAVGVMALYTPGTGERGYNSYERSIVRNVCLRLAYVRTGVATKEIANAITALRRRSPRRIQARSVSGRSAPILDLPDDLIGPAASMNDALAHVAAATDSHSVTLRALLPHSSSGAPHGLVLRRIAAFPPHRMEEPFNLHRPGDPGLHWDAISSGEECYVSNVSEDSHFIPEVRPDTQSALCVPVRVEGVIAGTLNVESPFGNNYATTGVLLEALAGAIGRTLADGRANSENSVLQKAAFALAKRHEYSGYLNKIETLVSSISDDQVKGAITKRLHKMDTIVKDLRDPVSYEDTDAASLWRLCKTELEELELRKNKRPSDPIFHLKINPEAAYSIVVLLRQLVSNLYKYQPDDALPSVKYQTCLLQGRTQAVVIIKNRSKSPLDPQQCQGVYRYPVAGSQNKLRLGTYIAAVHARRIGATLTALSCHDDSVFKTTLIIPITELSG